MDNQKIVLVLGQTGVGKSTFINQITSLYGKYVVTSSSLDSCTQEVTQVHILIDGMSVCLVDTPGFDDTNRADNEILSLIHTWLTNKNMSISLVLYIQRITDVRMRGMSLKNMSMIEKFCDRGMECLHFVTSMWDIVGDDGNKREMELITNYWKLALSKGSGFARLGSISHNLSLLRKLLANSGQLTEIPNIDSLSISDVIMTKMEESIKKKEQVHENEISNVKNTHKAELSSTKSLHDAKVAALNDKIKSLESKLATVTGSNATLKTSVSSLESELLVVTKSSKTLEYNASSLKLELVDITKSNAVLRATIASLESKLRTSTNANTTLECNISSLRSEIANVTQSKIDLEITVDLLKKEILDLSERLSKSVINIETGKKYVISNGNKWSYTGKVWGITDGWGGYFFITNTTDDEAYWYLTKDDVRSSTSKNQIHFALDTRHGIVMHDKNHWVGVNVKEA